MEASFPRVPNWQSVRNERWKYIHYQDLQGMDELYDLKKDPGEMQNLIHDAPAVLKELQKDLEKLKQETR